MQYKKGLIVSETGEFRDSMSSLLGLFDFEFIHALSGAQALEFYSEDPSYDLIIVDIDMQSMNGFTTSRLLRIHQVANRPYIVGVSCSPDSAGESSLSGLDAFILRQSPKPQKNTLLQVPSPNLTIIKGGRHKPREENL